MRTVSWTPQRPDSDIIRSQKGDRIVPKDSRTTALEAARASVDKKAKDPLVLDLRDLTFIADYFVICSGETTTQVGAIVEHIEKVLKKIGIRQLRIEGAGYSRWVLMDYGDVVVHVFEDETRAYYELEKLWLDAPRVPIDEAGTDSLGGKDTRAVSR